MLNKDACMAFEWEKEKNLKLSQHGNRRICESIIMMCRKISQAANKKITQQQQQRQDTVL